jgi:hypothetical protein
MDPILHVSPPLNFNDRSSYTTDLYSNFILRTISLHHSREDPGKTHSQPLTTPLRTQNDLIRGVLDNAFMAPEAYMNIDRVGGAEVFGFADQDMSSDWLDSILGN